MADPTTEIISAVSIVGLNDGATIPLVYTLRVDWSNGEHLAGEVAALCTGATVNPAFQSVAAEGSGTLYFTIAHAAAATGVTITATLTVDGNGLDSNSVENLTVA